MRAKLTDVEPKMAVVLAEAISTKEESGRYKNSLIDFASLMTRILVEQNLRKLEMPDYTDSLKVGRTERSGPIVFYCVKNEL